MLVHLRGHNSVGASPRLTSEHLLGPTGLPPDKPELEGSRKGLPL
jgi:hypothetical protein